MLSGELSRSPTPSKSKGFLPLPTSTLAPATCTGQDPKNMPGHSSNLGPTWDRTAQPTPESTTRVNKKTRPWLDPQSPPASQCTEPLGPQDPTGTRARDSPSRLSWSVHSHRPPLVHVDAIPHPAQVS